ncbi:hypothetical protein GGR54DRAFT_650835 [Hypoxylon sp. NC1633]|nr:hypothetical protein GGR54DRAFT_650835 [Hypoxylon sp. NC1633]
MALVDYSSSDSEPAAEEPTSVSAKRRKISHGTNKPLNETAAALPPLPAAFHDLYASTVRVSTTDDPALHQGRKRVNPHKAGNWPSHLYIEWHPTPPQLHQLTSLLSALTLALSPLSVTLHSFLTSDLGAPQPLHVSLSRPIVLSTAQKDGFLEQLTSRIGGCGVAPFDLAPRGLEWHRTRESERSFLVLSVGAATDTITATTPTSPASTDPNSPLLQRGRKAAGPALDGHTEQEQEEEPVSTTPQATPTNNAKPPQPPPQSQNPELTTLLHHCNALAKAHAQPPLYASRPGTGSRADAFHISIAWSFAEPTAEVRRRTEEVFTRMGLGGEILGTRVRVDGIKAKIGNVVTHVQLPVRGRREKEREKEKEREGGW